MNAATPILDQLYEDCVFDVTKTKDGNFKFEEACDGYFSTFLTKEQVIALAEELKALAQD